MYIEQRKAFLSDFVKLTFLKQSVDGSNAPFKPVCTSSKSLGIPFKMFYASTGETDLTREILQHWRRWVNHVRFINTSKRRMYRTVSFVLMTVVSINLMFFQICFQLGTAGFMTQIWTLLLSPLEPPTTDSFPHLPIQLCSGQT